MRITYILTSASASVLSPPRQLTRESVDGLGVGGVLSDVVPVELAEEVAAVPLGLVLGVLQHRRRHHAHGGGRGALCKLFIHSNLFISKWAIESTKTEKSSL